MKDINEIYKKIKSGELHPAEIENYLTDEMILRELVRRIKELRIKLEWDMVECYNCKAEVAIGLSIKGYHIDFYRLTKEVEKIRNCLKEIENKSTLFKDFSDDDLRTEIWRRDWQREKDRETEKENEEN